MKNETSRFRHIFAFLLFLVGQVLTGAVPVHASPADSDIPFLDKTQENQLDSYQQQATVKLLDAADWFDRFFDTENYSTEVNKTRMKVSLDIGYTEQDNFEFKPRASLRLNVPRLANRVNFLLFATDTSELEPEKNPITEIPRHEDSERKDLTTALQYFIKETREKNISVLSGVSFNYLYAGLRYRKLRDLGSWQFRFTNSITYYTDDGWNDRVSFQLERRISEPMLFRSGLSFNWLEDRDGLPHSLIFQLFQTLNKEQAILYEVAGFFDTDQGYSFTDLQLLFHYRQRFYRDWLVAEVVPVVSFPEEKDREFSPGMIFKIEAEFGYRSDSRLYNSVFNF